MSRQLTSGVLGRKMKIPIPMDGMFAWFDSEKITSAINDPILVFPDSSGNGYDATQSISLNAPVLKIDSNGNKYTEWEGGNKRLTTPTFSTKEQPNTIFAVVSRGLAGTSAYGVFDGVTDDFRHFFHFNDTVSSHRPALFAGTSISWAGSKDDSVFAYELLINTSNSYIKKNNSVLVSGNIGTRNLNGITIGSRFTPLSGDWQSYIGRIYELIFYNKILSVEDTKKINAYLKSKYNLIF